MTSPSNPALQKLRDLDKSLSGFHDQLSNVLYGEEYARCVANLQGDDLKWLVDFLDGVRYHVFRARFPLNRRRLLAASLISVLLPGNVCANSGAYAELGLYSPRRTPFRLTSILTPLRSMREALVMYTKGPSMAHWFALSASGSILSKIKQCSRKSVFDAIAPCFD
jgi:hypothetical protein